MTRPAKIAQQVPLGPQVGAPPSIEQVTLDRLKVDSAYQRSIDGEASRRIINGMIRQWNWALCQPLAVARRDDGGLYVLDGQHRLEGARRRGDIHFLPCVITSGLGVAGEAGTFVKLNTQRQRLSQVEVFRGMLAAGDPDAVAVQALLEQTGWRLTRTKNVAIWKPGDLDCGPMLVRMRKARGEEAVRFALTILRAAYPETAVTVCATLLAALGEVFNGDDLAEIPAADLAAAIGKIEPRRWRLRAVKHRERFPAISEQTAIAQCFLEAAKALPAPGPDMPLTPAERAHPAIKAEPQQALRPAPSFTSTPRPAAKPSPFGTEGKGWCNQCDGLRTRDHAARCTSKFCSLKAHA